MEQQLTESSIKPFGFLPWIERVFLAAFILGGIFRYFDFGISRNLLQISVLGLAVVFFIYLFKPHEIYKSQEEADKYENSGMMHILCLLIIPKILWISCWLSGMALFIHWLNLVHDGSIQISFMAGIAIAIALLILLVGWVKGVGPMRSVIPVLLRAIPALIIDYYLVFDPSNI